MSALDMVELQVLYFDISDDAIPVSEIAELVGEQHVSSVRGHIDPIPVMIRCNDCRELTWAYVASRTEMRGTLALGSGRRRSLERTGVCSWCEYVREERTATWWAERQALLEHLRTMPYREYLKTEHWQVVRKRALRIAGYRCQLCNERGLLDVHHRTYERRGEERPTDVTVLCRPCHAKHHGREV